MKKIILGLVIFTAALLLSACNDNNGETVDLVPDPDITNTDEIDTDGDNTAITAVMTPFIMPREGTEEYSYYAEKMDIGCVPGYLYLKNNTEDLFFLLAPFEFDEEDGLYQYTPIFKGYVNWRYVYGVARFSDGERILKVDKTNGEYEEVYTAESGSVELVTASERTGDGSGCLFFKDGDSVRALVPSRDEIIICAESESGVTDIKCEEFIYERVKNGGVSENDVYVCDICVEQSNNEYVIWADGEGQYYWYHIHSGENEPIDFQFTYYPFYCFNDLIFSGSSTEEASPYDWDNWGAWGQWELYSRNRESGERTLLAENVIYHYDYLTEHTALFIAEQDGVKRLMAIDERAGEPETVYEFKGDDIHMGGSYGRRYDESGVSYLCFLFGDGDSVISLDSSTLDITKVYSSRYGGLEFIDSYTTLNAWLLRDGNMMVNVDGDSFAAEELFELENGLSQVNLFPFVEEQISYGFLEYEDTSDLYICVQCIGNDDYIIWADSDGNWFWYHHHSGENEPINIDTERYTYTDYWDGTEYPISYITKAE